MIYLEHFQEGFDRENLTATDLLWRGSGWWMRESGFVRRILMGLPECMAMTIYNLSLPIEFCVYYKNKHHKHLASQGEGDIHVCMVQEANSHGHLRWRRAKDHQYLEENDIHYEIRTKRSRGVTGLAIDSRYHARINQPLYKGSRQLSYVYMIYVRRKDYDRAYDLIF